jgi:hypothetical protein
MTPLYKVEVLYHHLVQSYEGAKDAEVRAASKLLMVALYNLQANDDGWYGLVKEYIEIIKEDTARFELFMCHNRSDYKDNVLVLPTRNKY